MERRGTNPATDALRSHADRTSADALPQAEKTALPKKGIVFSEVEKAIIQRDAQRDVARRTSAPRLRLPNT